MEDRCRDERCLGRSVRRVLAGWLNKCLPPSGLAFERVASSLGSSSRAWLETGSCTFPLSGVPVAWLHPDDGRQHDMVLIGIDPHQGVAHGGGYRPRRNQARRAPGPILQAAARAAVGTFRT